MVNKDIVDKLRFVLPVDDKRPFRKVASKLGMGEQELLLLLNKYSKNKTIRRFGAVLDHRKVGFTSNALVCWQVAGKKIDEFGRYLSSLHQITHCYLRKKRKEWPYNIYAMVHTQSKRECRKVVEEICRNMGIKNYRIMFTLKEFKKTRAVYLK